MRPLTALSELTRLQLCQLRYNSLGFSPLSCLTQLQHLEISSHRLDDWERDSFSRLSAAVLQHLSSLEHLHLRGSACGIERSAEAQLAQLTRLTHLWVLDLRVEGATAEAVLQLPQLRELGCAYIAGPAVPLAGPPLPQLTQLCVGELHRLWNAEDVDVPPYYQMPEQPPAGAGPEDVQAFDEADAAAWQAALDLCSTRGCLLGLLPLPRLRQLQVSVADDDWAPLAAELALQTSLSSLSLIRPLQPEQLDERDDGVDLALLAPTLQQLVWLKHLTCMGAKLELGFWKAIARRKSRLRSLELCECRMQLPHVSLLHRCPALREIRLSNCTGVEDDEALLLGTLVVKPGLRKLVFEDWSARWDDVCSEDEYALQARRGFRRVEDIAALLRVQLEIRTG